jgi:hypothetical protein
MTKISREDASNTTAWVKTGAFLSLPQAWIQRDLGLARPAWQCQCSRLKRPETAYDYTSRQPGGCANQRHRHLAWRPGRWLANL